MHLSTTRKLAVALNALGCAAMFTLAACTPARAAAQGAGACRPADSYSA